MSMSSKSMNIFLTLSCLCCFASMGMLIICLFSADYRYIEDREVKRATWRYGLIRYCYEPERTNYQSDDSNGAMCYLRSKAPPNEVPINYKQHYGPFEMTTLILLAVSICSALGAVCFAICNLLTKFGAFAHSITCLGAAMCAAAGFTVYTYFNELRENQTETISGNYYKFHFGWAYYVTGVATGILLLGFVFSLLGSAFTFVHSSEVKRVKEDSRHMDTRL